MVSIALSATVGTSGEAAITIVTATAAAVGDLVDASWLLAVLAVVVAWVGSKLLAERLRPRLEERVLRPSTANAVLLVVRAAIVLYAFVPFAGLLGFRPQNVLLSFTVLSLVLGAVLAPVGRSYISGLFILVHRPYEVGDMIELVDREERGYVDDITLGYTKVFTLENSFLVVPNETMRERDIRNLSADDERSRLSLEVCVTYEGDLDRACELLEGAAQEVDGVIAGGPPIRVGRSTFPAGPKAFVREFADHGIVIDLKCWIEAPYLPSKIRSAIHRRAWTALEDEEDVAVAYPHTHHVFDETSGRARVDLESLDGRDRPARASAPIERGADTSADDGDASRPHSRRPASGWSRDREGSTTD